MRGPRQCVSGCAGHDNSVNVWLQAVVSVSDILRDVNLTENRLGLAMALENVTTHNALCSACESRWQEMPAGVDTHQTGWFEGEQDSRILRGLIYRVVQLQQRERPWSLLPVWYRSLRYATSLPTNLRQFDYDVADLLVSKEEASAAQHKLALKSAVVDLADYALLVTLRSAINPNMEWYRTGLVLLQTLAPSVFAAALTWNKRYAKVPEQPFAWELLRIVMSVYASREHVKMDLTPWIRAARKSAQQGLCVHSRGDSAAKPLIDDEEQPEPSRTCSVDLGICKISPDRFAAPLYETPPDQGVFDIAPAPPVRQYSETFLLPDALDNSKTNRLTAVIHMYVRNWRQWCEPCHTCTHDVEAGRPHMKKWISKLLADGWLRN